MSRPALAVFAALAAASLAACGSSSSGSSQAAATSAPASSAAPSSGSPAGAGTALKIMNFAYDPTPLTVKPGESVAVTNTDGAEHTVTSDQKGLFLADDVKQGNTVTFKAPTRPGTYTFHCQYHASMHGTLVVTG
jgi:plastocyanin